MRQALVNILIVTYNADKFIKKTIHSCLKQTYSECEILILDNNSTDNTVDIIKEIRDERIHLYQSHENLGPYAGLNYLLDRAKGDYIAIQDHDDIWFPEKIKQQLDFLYAEPDYSACGTNTYYYFEAKELLILCRKPFDTNFVDHTSLMFRNKGYRYNNNYVLADEHFEKKVLRTDGKIACLPDPLAVHRIKKDNTNLSSSRFKASQKNVNDLFFVNGYTFSSFVYLLDLMTNAYIPQKLIFFIRRHITLRHCDWITRHNFEKLHSNICL